MKLFLCLNKVVLDAAMLVHILGEAALIPQQQGGLGGNPGDCTLSKPKTSALRL